MVEVSAPPSFAYVTTYDSVVFESGEFHVINNDASPVIVTSVGAGYGSTGVLTGISVVDVDEDVEVGISMMPTTLTVGVTGPVDEK